MTREKKKKLLKEIDYRLNGVTEYLKRHPDMLNQVVWIKRPKIEKFLADLTRIRKDVLHEKENNLSKDNFNAIVLKRLSKKPKGGLCD